MDGSMRIIRAIEWLNEHVGRTVAWLTLTMVVTTFAVAVLRYGFSMGWVWLQESYVWMHGTIIMMAAGYTLLHDGHVRVDIFYRAASMRTKAWVNIIGTTAFLFPTLAVVAWVTTPYVLLSWERWETSREAGGMVGLFLLKTTMAGFFILMALQGLAMLLRSVLVLQGKLEWEPGETSSLKGRG